MFQPDEMTHEGKIRAQVAAAIRSVRAVLLSFDQFRERYPNVDIEVRDVVGGTP